MSSLDLWFIVNGILLAAVIILIWLIYAYYYKTSVTRLSKLAGKKYLPTVPADIQSKYVILCDAELSKYDSASHKFTAVITMTPDMNHPDAPKKPHVTKIYDVINVANPCENNQLACGESNPDDCLKPSAKTIVVSAARCININ